MTKKHWLLVLLSAVAAYLIYSRIFKRKQIETLKEAVAESAKGVFWMDAPNLPDGEYTAVWRRKRVDVLGIPGDNWFTTEKGTMRVRKFEISITGGKVYITKKLN